MDEAEAKVLALMDRFWNDIAGLPWNDPVWTGNSEQRQKAKEHYVKATTADILEAVKGENDEPER